MISHPSWVLQNVKYFQLSLCSDFRHYMKYVMVCLVCLELFHQLFFFFHFFFLNRVQTFVKLEHSGGNLKIKGVGKIHSACLAWLQTHKHALVFELALVIKSFDNYRLFCRHRFIVLVVWMSVHSAKVAGHNDIFISCFGLELNFHWTELQMSVKT